MGLKDLVNKGKCLVGLHDGEWRPVAPRDCTFVRVCVRCQLESRRVDHLWPEWAYRADRVCDQARVCSRCSTEEQRVQHMWGVAAYVRADSCTRQHTCSRCAATSPADTQHHFDTWRFTGPDDCSQLQACSRCQADGAARRVEHTWTDWQHSNAKNGLVRVCRRCGDLQVQPSPAQSPAPPPSAPPPSAPPPSAPPPSAPLLPAEEKAPVAASNSSVEPNRKATFDALKNKMDALSDSNASMERVLDSLAEQYEKLIAEAEAAEPPATKKAVEPPPHRPAPPVFSDDDVADLLWSARALEDAASRDERLVAQWQNQTIIPGGYGVSGMTTSYDLTLRDDGRFALLTQSWGPMTTQQSQKGVWHSHDSLLTLTFDEGGEVEYRYEFINGALYLPGTRWTLKWKRIR